MNNRQSGKIAQPEAESLKELSSKAYLIGYQRARDQFNATKDIKYVMQASPCKNYEDFLDLEVIEQGLRLQQQHANLVTVKAWKDEMTKRDNKFTEAEVTKMTDATGRIKVPFSMEQARNRPDYNEFIKSSKVEWDGIEGHKTFGDDMKLQAIRDMGIKQSIVPCREILQIKEVDGKVEKWKNRLVIQGSPNNCKKGEHYHETYSPAPNCTTTRIMMSLVVQLGLLLISVDISQAYLWSRMSLHERMPIRMPLHRHKYDKITGEELY